MLDASRRWDLFGYDLSRVAHYVRAGWTEFLWGEESPVLPAVDEVVLAHRDDGRQQYLLAGKAVAQPSGAQPEAQAVVLPDSLALTRVLHVPVAAEAGLASVVALEVTSHSPFPAGDTCRGWSVTGRTETSVEVLLAISSRSAVMAHIAGKFNTHELEDFEVWVDADGRMVMLEGFGEAARRGRNRRRLRRAGMMLGYCLALLLLLPAVAAGAKYFELERVRGYQEEALRASGDAVRQREYLGESRELMDAVERYLNEYPSPHGELKRLAQLLGDDTWISGVDIAGDSMRIEGEASNASAVMQALLEHPAYARVQAPVAFKTQRSGLERFVFDLSLAPREPAP